MAMASAQEEPVPNIPVCLYTVPTQNLLGFPGIIPPRRVEIRYLFQETVQNTRLNLQLLNNVSQLFQSYNSFKTEKINITSLTTQGSDAQLVVTKPTHSY